MILSMALSLNYTRSRASCLPYIFVRGIQSLCLSLYAHPKYWYVKTAFFRLEDISEFVQAWKQVPKSQREEFLKMRKQSMAERQTVLHHLSSRLVC